jgi:hypothetical protein
MRLPHSQQDLGSPNRRNVRTNQTTETRRIVHSRSAAMTRSPRDAKSKKRPSTTTRAEVAVPLRSRQGNHVGKNSGSGDKRFAAKRRRAIDEIIELGRKRREKGTTTGWHSSSWPKTACGSAKTIAGRVQGRSCARRARQHLQHDSAVVPAPAGEPAGDQGRHPLRGGHLRLSHRAMRCCAPAGASRSCGGRSWPSRAARGPLMCRRPTEMILTLPPDDKLAKFAAYPAARDLR